MSSIPASIPLHRNAAEDTGAQRAVPRREDNHSGKQIRLPVRIARELAAAILNGGYKPGDRLFGEIAFSDRLNVSRATYREAIQILAAKGMVKSTPRGGTLVNPRTMWQLLDPDILDVLFACGPEPALFEDLRELLDLLVPKAAALASARCDVDMLALMQAAFGTMRQCEISTPENRKACREFYRTMFLAGGNAYVVSLARGLAAAIDTVLDLQWHHAIARHDPIQDHLRILRAIEEHNSEDAVRGAQTLLSRAFTGISQNMAAPE